MDWMQRVGQWFSPKETTPTIEYTSTTEYQGALTILSQLEEAGYEAYIVGGAVRDICMHVLPKDYDIVTSAKPEEVQAVLREAGFTVTDVVGQAFGIVVVATEAGAYEIATFRKDVYGEDSHRPESIEYADTLEEDVKRRDFTINGMAMDRTGHIIDYVEGRKDIKRKMLRTIGYSGDRFREDALRMFRACRFIGRFGFTADDDLVEGIRQNLSRVNGLSLERVRQELDGLLMTEYVAKGLDLMVRTGLSDASCRVKEDGQYRPVAILPELAHLVDLPQEKQFHAYDGWYHTLAVVNASALDYTVRWGALLHDVAKGMPGIRGFNKGRITDYGHDKEGARMAHDMLVRLGYPKALADRVSWLVLNHMRFHYFRNNEEADPCKWIRKEARSGVFRRSHELEEALMQLAKVCAADIVGTGRNISDEAGAIEFGDCLRDVAHHIPIHTKDLHYPKDLPSKLGPHVKVVLHNLLERVQNGQLENEETALEEAAFRALERHGKGN